MEKKCKNCRLIIIEDYEKWLEDNPKQKYIACSYCGYMEKIR